jgi:hypothetical protein
LTPRWCLLVFPAFGKPTNVANRMEPSQLGRLSERFCAYPSCDICVLQPQRRRMTPCPCRGLIATMVDFLSTQVAIRSGMSPNIGPDGHLGKSMLGNTNGSTTGLQVRDPIHTLLYSRIILLCSICRKISNNAQKYLCCDKLYIPVTPDTYTRSSRRHNA